MTMLNVTATASIMMTFATAYSTGADVLLVPSEYPTIQSAIDTAVDGDTVLVSAGIYNEGIDFLGKQIIVESEDGSDATTIDGLGLDVSIVKCVSGETDQAVFRGFRLYRGISGTQDFTDSLYLGGGMYINSSSPTVEDVVFDECRSGYGGGLYAIWSDSVIRDCVFRRCIANSNSGAAQAFFNGVTFDGCEFIENWSSDYGGAVHAIQGYHVFNDCTFTRNGGPWYSDTITYTDDGGAISWFTYIDDSLDELPRMTITNCVLIDNRSAQDGGGLWVKPGYDSVDITNTTICDNMTFNVTGRYTDLGGNDICICTGDFNGDGEVSGADLSVLLGYWGDCQDLDCAPDLNFDGVIDGVDLASLLSAWGSCAP